MFQITKWNGLSVHGIINLQLKKIKIKPIAATLVFNNYG